MPRPGKQTTERAKDFKGTLRQLLSALSQYKLSLIVVMVFAILSTIFNIAGPKILAKATTALATGWIAKLRGIGGIDFAYIGKILYEEIETVDMGPFEAMEALGANKFQAFWSACVPQILPVYLSHSLYCFEMNVRASAILGYVGAGGLGITINERIGWRDYNSLGMVLLSLFVVVVAIDFFSEYLRRKLS